MLAPTSAGFGDAVLTSERSALVLLTTRRETMAVCCKLPLVAVIVSGKVPTGVLALVVIVIVDVFAEASVMLMGVGLKLALAPVGNPLALKLTFPVKPPEGVMVTV